MAYGRRQVSAAVDRKLDYLDGLMANLRSAAECLSMCEEEREALDRLVLEPEDRAEELARINRVAAQADGTHAGCERLIKLIRSELMRLGRLL